MKRFFIGRFCRREADLIVTLDPTVVERIRADTEPNPEDKLLVDELEGSDKLYLDFPGWVPSGLGAIEIATGTGYFFVFWPQHLQEVVAAFNEALSQNTPYILLRGGTLSVAVSMADGKVILDNIRDNYDAYQARSRKVWGSLEYAFDSMRQHENLGMKPKPPTNPTAKEKLVIQ